MSFFSGRTQEMLQIKDHINNLYIQLSEYVQFSNAKGEEKDTKELSLESIAKKKGEYVDLKRDQADKKPQCLYHSLKDLVNMVNVQSEPFSGIEVEKKYYERDILSNLQELEDNQERILGVVQRLQENLHSLSKELMNITSKEYNEVDTMKEYLNLLREKYQSNLSFDRYQRLYQR
jgi:hypothetical protein